MRRFLVPTLAMLLLVPLLSFLGFWQLGRAEEKRALQAEYDRRAVQAPTPLGAELQDADELQFRRLKVRGNYESEYQLLWDNRIHNGAPGYHVITPLRIEGSDTRVLVNRGWLEAGPDRGILPNVEPPGEPVTISGTAVKPRVDFMLGELDPLQGKRLTIWQQLDLARYAREVQWPMHPIVILLDPESPGGYVREWARLDAGIAVHQGYAFQWFTLAAAVLVLYVVLMWRALKPLALNGD